MLDSNLNIGIFSAVVVVILVIIIFEYKNKFKKPTLTSKAIGFIKYLALVIPLKPFITYFGYPFRPIVTKYPSLCPVPCTGYKAPGDVQPLGYHLDNIFEYETITFLYSFVLVILLYLFIPKKVNKN